VKKLVEQKSTKLFTFSLFHFFTFELLHIFIQKIGDEGIKLKAVFQFRDAVSFVIEKFIFNYCAFVF